MELPNDIWAYILELRGQSMARDLLERVTRKGLKNRHMIFSTGKMHLVRNAFNQMHEDEQARYRTRYDCLLACHTAWQIYYH